MLNNEVVARNLRNIRGNIPVKAFAARLYVSEQTVYHWEKGIAVPSLSMADMIREEFKVSLDDIYYGDNSSKKQTIEAIDLCAAAS